MNRPALAVFAKNRWSFQSQPGLDSWAASLSFRLECVCDDGSRVFIRMNLRPRMRIFWASWLGSGKQRAFLQLLPTSSCLTSPRAGSDRVLVCVQTFVRPALDQRSHPASGWLSAFISAPPRMGPPLEHGEREKSTVLQNKLQMAFLQTSDFVVSGKDTRNKQWIKWILSPLSGFVWYTRISNRSLFAKHLRFSRVPAVAVILHMRLSFFVTSVFFQFHFNAARKTTRSPIVILTEPNKGSVMLPQCAPPNPTPLETHTPLLTLLGTFHWQIYPIISSYASQSLHCL